MLSAPRPSPVQRLLLRAAATQAAVELGATTDGAGPVLQVVGSGDTHLDACVLAPMRPEDVASGPVSGVLHLDGRRWAFEADVAHEAGHLRLSPVRRVRPVQRRTSPRIAAPADATLLFAHGERVLRRALVDLSATGLAIRLLDGPDEPKAGAVLPEARFALPVGAPILGAATIRHVREQPDGTLLAGLDLLGLSAPDARRLDAWVRGQTRTRRRDEAAESARAFATTTASLPGDRVRPVLDLDDTGVVIGLQPGDRDVEVGASFDRVELALGSNTAVVLRASVADVVTHRARPLQARLAWSKPRREELGRLARLLRAVGR